MQLMDVLRSAQDGKAIGNVAQTFGITPAQAEAAIAAVVPQLGRAMERTSLSRGGLADIVAALGDARYQHVLADPAALKSPETAAAGIGLLEQMLGNKDQSRALAARAAASSGLTEMLIKQLLPYIIPMIVGGLAKSSGGALGDVLSKIPGMPGGSTRAPSGFDTGGGFGGPHASAPQQQPYQPAPAPRSGSPLPLPGGHTPLGDGNPYSDLSDTIRRGGSVGTSGGLPGLVRSILGGLLGFQSRGVIGWIVRLIVMRWGWSILRFIFGRLLGGR